MAWDKCTAANNDSVNLAPRAAHDPHPAATGRGGGGGGGGIVSAIAEAMRDEASAPQPQSTGARPGRRRVSISSRRGSNESTSSLASELSGGGGGGGGGGLFNRHGSGASSAGGPTRRRRVSLSLSEMDDDQRRELERVRSAIKDLDAHTNSAVRELLSRHVASSNGDDDESDSVNGHDSFSSLDLGDFGDEVDLDALEGVAREGGGSGSCKVTEFRRAVKRLSVSCLEQPEEARDRSSNSIGSGLMKRFGASLNALRLEDELVES